MKAYQKILLGALTFCLLFCGCTAQKASSRGVTVTVMDIGKADAILIESGEHAVLIDTGEAEDGEEIAQCLTNRGIRSLDALILTHLDKDHIGGAPSVLAQVTVGALIQANYEENSAAASALAQACAQANATPHKLLAETTLSLGDAQLRLLPAEQARYEEDNDYSIIAELTCGTRRFLFAGDATELRLREYLAQRPGAFDFLKVPHHGRLEDCSQAFFAAVSPRYAVITCSKKKQPDAQVLALLAQCGAEVFLTSNGTVTAVCDGNSLSVTQKP